MAGAHRLSYHASYAVAKPSAVSEPHPRSKPPAFTRPHVRAIGASDAGALHATDACADLYALRCADAGADHFVGAHTFAIGGSVAWSDVPHTASVEGPDGFTPPHGDTNECADSGV